MKGKGDWTVDEIKIVTSMVEFKLPECTRVARLNNLKKNGCC